MLWSSSVGGSPDVAVDAAGGTIDELFDAGGVGFFEADARAVHVDVVIVAFGNIQFAEGGGQVLDDFHALHATLDALAVGDGANHHFRAPLAQFFGFEAFLVVQRNHLMAVVQQTPNQCLSGETRAARD